MRPLVRAKIVAAVIALPSLIACSTQPSGLPSQTLTSVNGSGSSLQPASLLLSNLPRVTNVTNNTLTTYTSGGPGGGWGKLVSESGGFPNLNGPSCVVWRYGLTPSIFYVCNATAIQVYDTHGYEQPNPGAFKTTVATSIAFDGNNGLLYATIASPTSRMQVLDQSGNVHTEPGGFPNLSQPSGVKYDPDNQLLYATNQFNGTITVYNAQGYLQNLGSGAFPNLYKPLALTYDGLHQLFYVVNTGTGVGGDLGHITAYNAQGVQQTLPHGAFPNLNRPTGIDWNVANKLLFVTNMGTNNVTVYDWQGNQQNSSGLFPNISGPSAIANGS